MKKLILMSFMLIMSSLVFAEEIVLNYNSYGPIEFGTDIKKVEKLLKEKARKSNRDETGCYYVTFKRFPKVSFMIVEGKVKRVDVGINNPTILNIPVSFKLKDVKKMYLNVNIKTHTYDPAGYYFVFNNPNKTKAILYEYYENKIQYIRAGLKPEVEFVEGCL